MAAQVRLSEHEETCDTPGLWKFVPYRRCDGPQAHFTNGGFENCSNSLRGLKHGWQAAVSVDDPGPAGVHALNTIITLFGLGCAVCKRNDGDPPASCRCVCARPEILRENSGRAR